MEKPLISNADAKLLSFHINRAKRAREQWRRAASELSRLEIQSGVLELRQHVADLHLKERSAFLDAARLIERLVPNYSEDDADENFA